MKCPNKIENGHDFHLCLFTNLIVLTPCRGQLRMHYPQICNKIHNERVRRWLNGGYKNQTNKLRKTNNDT